MSWLKLCVRVACFGRQLLKPTDVQQLQAQFHLDKRRLVEAVAAPAGPAAAADVLALPVRVDHFVAATRVD